MAFNVKHAVRYQDVNGTLVKWFWELAGGAFVNVDDCLDVEPSVTIRMVRSHGKLSISDFVKTYPGVDTDTAVNTVTLVICDRVIIALVDQVFISSKLDHGRSALNDVIKAVQKYLA